MLPSSMAWQLFQQGVIDKAEFLGGGVSELANGSQTRDLRFRLRSVNIGAIVVQNITCVVVDGDGGALLGQAVLSKLRSWKIDNERQFCSGAVRLRATGEHEDLDGMALEPFELHTTSCSWAGSLNSGGCLVTETVPPTERYTSLAVFERCVAHAATDLLRATW